MKKEVELMLTARVLVEAEPVEGAPVVVFGDTINNAAALLSSLGLRALPKSVTVVQIKAEVVGARVI